MSTLRVSSAFDGGNAEVVEATDPGAIRLRIREDAAAGFLQWFHFRVTGADAPIVVRIENAGDAAYAKGWVGYQAVASTDRERWVRVPTSYADGVLEIRHPAAPAVWFAYFAPSRWSATTTSSPEPRAIRG